MQHFTICCFILFLAKFIYSLFLTECFHVDDLFTVSWLLVTFVIISIISAFMEVYSILSDVCDTMLCIYYFCVLLLIVSSQNMIVGYLLVCLFIFFTSEACIYAFPCIVGFNISKCIPFPLRYSHVGSC